MKQISPYKWGDISFLYDFLELWWWPSMVKKEYELNKEDKAFHAYNKCGVAY
jgi:hypothetical protein